MKIYQPIFGMCLTAFLTACGGGGGGTTAPAAAASAAGTSEGFWSGTASSGVKLNIAILDNGETWGLYTNGGSLAGALYGTSTGTGTTFAASGSDFNFQSWAVTNGSYSGTVAAKSTINAKTATGATLALSYDSSYDTAASAAAIAGNYTVSGISASGSATSVPLTITLSGLVTTTITGTCTASGTVAPRAGGKNVYNIAMTFTGTGCALGNGGTASGIFVLDKSVTPAQVIAIALTPSKNDGFFAVGTKL